MVNSTVGAGFSEVREEKGEGGGEGKLNERGGPGRVAESRERAC